MKNLILLISIYFCFFSFKSTAQTTRVFKGEPVNDEKFGQHGIVEYSYFEDPATHEYVKQGPFKYVFNGVGEYKGFNQVITGQFNKGLKTGKWTYSIVYIDYKENQDNKHWTGTINLTSNYSNGYANGAWKYNSNLKYRGYFFKYPNYYWGEYTEIGKDTINAKFKNNYIVDKLHIYDKRHNFYADASFNNNSMCDGAWRIQDNTFDILVEEKFKGGLKIDYVKRKYSTTIVEEIKNYKNELDLLSEYQNLQDTSSQKKFYELDTFTTIASENLFAEYFRMLLNNDRYLYKSIGGDFTFNEGFKGSLYINIKKYHSLNEITGFYDNYQNYYTLDSAYKAYKNSGFTLDDIIKGERWILNSFIKKIASEYRLDNLKDWRKCKSNSDSVGLFLIWNKNSKLKLDSLAKEDRLIIERLVSVFKDSLDNSNKFLIRKEKIFEKLFKKYYKNLIEAEVLVGKYPVAINNDPLEIINRGFFIANPNEKYVQYQRFFPGEGLDCFLSEKIFDIEDNSKNRSVNSIEYPFFYIPKSNVLKVNEKLIECARDTNWYGQEMILYIKRYVNLFYTLQDLPNNIKRLDAVNNKGELEYLFLGDLTNSHLVLDSIDSEIDKFGLKDIIENKKTVLKNEWMPQIQFDSVVFNFGDIYIGDTVLIEFGLINKGRFPLLINSIQLNEKEKRKNMMMGLKEDYLEVLSLPNESNTNQVSIKQDEKYKLKFRFAPLINVGFLEKDIEVYSNSMLKNTIPDAYGTRTILKIRANVLKH